MKALTVFFEEDELDEQLIRAKLAETPYTVAHLAPSDLPKSEGIFFKVKNRLEKISPSDIRWVQASDIYAIIRTHKARYLVSHTLKSLEEKLSSNEFCRVHRSYLVRLSEISAIEDGQLVIGDDHIPIGQTHRDSLMERLDFM